MNTRKKVLLTGGRAPVTLDIARLLSASGHLVVIAETNKMHLCRFSRAIAQSFVVPAPIYGTLNFANALVELIKTHHIDFLIPMCEEVFAIAAHYDLLSSHCKLLCEPLSKLEPLHNKAKFIQILKSLNLSYPKTILLTDPHRVDTSDLGEKLVYKPVYSRFARDVIICKTGESNKIKSINPSKEKPWIVQEFIEGRRLCTYSIANQGKLVAHVTYPVELSIGDIGSALAFRSIKHQRSMDLVKRLIESLSFTGQISLDLIERKDGSIVPIECNPRATSGLHLFNKSDHLPDILMGGDQTAFLPNGRKAHLGLALCLLGNFKQKPKLIINTLLDGNDAIFRWPDLMPGVMFPILLAFYGWQAFKKGMAITEVSTYDIEFNGDPCQ